MKDHPIKTKAGKRQFIRDLCNAIRNEACAKARQMPKDWDGHELRVYLAEKFEDSARMSLVRAYPRSPLAKAYRNEMLTRNL